MFKRRSYLDSHWHARLDELMGEVLRNPERFHRSIVVWAEWRRRWLAGREASRPEGGRNRCNDSAGTAPRIKFSRELEPLNAADFNDEQNDQTK